MSFPWTTEAQRRRQREDEEFAARAMADFSQQYRRHVDGINRATDSEIDDAMKEILRRQREVNVLRPGRRTRSRLEDLFTKGIASRD